MNVYVFNLLVGYMPNGIDNAQGYREKMFNQIGIDAFYVFTDFPKINNISYYNKIGIPINKMTNPFLKLTGRNSFDFVDKTESIIQSLNESLGKCEIKHLKDIIQIWKDGYIAAEVHTLPWNDQYFYEVLYFKKNCLIRTDFYSDGIVYSDFFVTDKRDDGGLYAKKVKRSFYSKDRIKILEQIDDAFILEDGRIISMYEIIDIYLDELHLKEEDSLIMDRAYDLEFNEVIFAKDLSCKKICVIHSGHYFEPNQSTIALYLNY